VTGDDRQRRWRLVLGGDTADTTGNADTAGPALSAEDAAVDAALAALYDANDGDPGEAEPRSGGLGASAPRVARWLGEIRRHFPSTVVQVMQADAIERLHLDRLLLEPEMLDAVEPDIHLVGTLLALRRVMPEASKRAARRVVSTLVADIERRFAQPITSAVTGALHRASRVDRPRHRDIDWDRTIRLNLRHYQPSIGTVIPHRLIGYGRHWFAAHREVVLCVDQSGSMATSVVYAGVFASVLASIRALRTSLVVFDTAVVDLTEHLDDPVDTLFGIQLGGGTDINRALAYASTLISHPRNTILILISDLYEGGAHDQMLRRITGLVRDGVQVVTLLALSDHGAPEFDRDNATALTALGIPAFACTPDAFADLMITAIERRDLRGFAERLP